MSEAKRLAGEKAIDYVEDGMIVGVGTGSTVAFFIDALARIKDRIAGTVSSSEQSTQRLRAHGIEVLDLNATGPLSLYVDGADALYKKAVGAGAKEAMPLDNQFWGDRGGAVIDPEGYTLYTYAAVQMWVQAANTLKTTVSSEKMSRPPVRRDDRPGSGTS